MNTLKERATELVSTGESLASIVRRLGNPVSTILLHSPCHIFSIPEVDGVIGYQIITNCAVIFGDPICLPEHTVELMQAFTFYCEKHHLSIVYLLASEPFARWAIRNGCQTLIQVGEELFIDPVNFKINQKLRWKINKSIQHGVSVKEYSSSNCLLEKQLGQIIETWAKARKGPQIYLGNLHELVSVEGNRTFYATMGDTIVGLVTLTPLDRLQGWVVDLFLAVDHAPPGTTEHLMSTAFEALASEKCHFCCLGAISGIKLGEVIGLNTISKFLARLIFMFSKWYFKLYAKKIYLDKYHPNSQPTYILFSKKLTINELMAIKQALNVRL